MERTTSLGLWHYASEYIEATELVAPKDNSVNRLAPSYHLLGHAIELVLKAFLRAKGFSLTRLKRRIGHDLDCALEEAERLELAKYISSDVHDRFACVVSMLAPYHLSHEFRYIQAGYKGGLPKIQEAIPAVKGIVDATKVVCGPHKLQAAAAG